jgi:triosephosphate isomerase
MAARYGVAAAIAPSAFDLGRLAGELRIPVLAQHTDSVDPGARTGALLAESIASSGGKGSLLNHSEHPLSPEDVGAAVTRLRSVGLAPVLCARNVDAARRLAEFHPPYLAIEPPELIGGDRSVSTERPEIVEGTVRAVKAIAPSTHVLCGAGIHDRRDVALALELGSEGVLVASAVACASDPARVLAELLQGFRPR